MGITLGGFDRMEEGDSKKMQKLVLNRAKTNQTRDLHKACLPTFEHEKDAESNIDVGVDAEEV